MLMLGREVRIPLDILFPSPQSHKSVEYGNYIHDLKDDMQDIHLKARQNLKKNVLRQQTNYDVNTSMISYIPGDIVWYLDETRASGKCVKLQNIWLGPCVVTTKLSDLNYEIQISPRKQKRIVHHDKLKPCYSKKIPQWCTSVKKEICKI